MQHPVATRIADFQQHAAGGLLDQRHDQHSLAMRNERYGMRPGQVRAAEFAR